MDAPISTPRGRSRAHPDGRERDEHLAEVCAVVSQAPSSNPAPMAPRMSARTEGPTTGRSSGNEGAHEDGEEAEPGVSTWRGTAQCRGADARRGRRRGRTHQGRSPRAVDLRVHRHAGQQPFARRRRRRSAILTAMSCTNLVKFPVALSGGSSAYSAPDAGATAARCPRQGMSRKNASTVISAFCPTLM